MIYALWLWKSKKLVGNSVVDKNTAEFDLWEKKPTRSGKIPVGYLHPSFGGVTIQNRSDGDRADYITRAWLAKDCDGKK